MSTPVAPIQHGEDERFGPLAIVRFSTVRQPSRVLPLQIGPTTGSRWACCTIGGCGRATVSHTHLTNGPWRAGGLPLPLPPLRTIFLNFENEVIEATKAAISVLQRQCVPFPEQSRSINPRALGPDDQR